jgi:hypothetical protein
MESLGSKAEGAPGQAFHGGAPSYVQPHSSYRAELADPDAGEPQQYPDEWKPMANVPGLTPQRAGGPQDPKAAEPAQMLDHLKPVSYNYKPGMGEDPNQRQYGILAQDLAKTPMGASAVQQRDDGMLSVDPAKATGVQLGAMANLNQRLRQLEANAPPGVASLAASDRNLKTQVKPAERGLKDFLEQVYARRL